MRVTHGHRLPSARAATGPREERVVAYKGSTSACTAPLAGGISSLLTKLLYYISWPVLTSSGGTQACLVPSLLKVEKEKLALGIRPRIGVVYDPVGGEFFSHQIRGWPRKGRHEFKIWKRAPGEHYMSPLINRALLGVQWASTAVIDQQAE